MDTEFKTIFSTIRSGQATDDYLRAHIDLESWAWAYIMEELSGDYDVGACSQFFTFDGNVIRAQAVWDFDISLGLLVHYSPESFLASRPWKDADIEASWFSNLLQYDIFNALVKDVFENVFYDELQELISTEIQQICQRIESSSLMDEIRWQDSYSGTNWKEATSKVYEYIKKRNDFLVSAWVNDVEYYTICLKGAYQYLYFSVEAGTTFDKLPDGKDIGIHDFISWIDEQTGETFDPDQIITEDRVLYANVNNVPLNWKGQLMELMTGHDTMWVFVFGAILGLSGVILLFADVRRNGKGDMHGKN